MCVNYDCSDRASELEDLQERAKYCERSFARAHDAHRRPRCRCGACRRHAAGPYEQEVTLVIEGAVSPASLAQRVRFDGATRTDLTGAITLFADGRSRGSVAVMTSQPPRPPEGCISPPRVDWQFLGE